MKKAIFTILRHCTFSLVAILTAVSFTACSDDDETATFSPQSFTGELSTSIPAMPSFQAVSSSNAMTIIWADATQTSATVQLGEINLAVTTPMGEKVYQIGEMTIEGVTCTKEGATIQLSKPQFECQAGKYLTTGSLTGTLENNELSVTLLYKPGSMPFMVQSIFTSK